MRVGLLVAGDVEFLPVFLAQDAAQFLASRFEPRCGLELIRSERTGEEDRLVDAERSEERQQRLPGLERRRDCLGCGLRMLARRPCRQPNPGVA
jgi:hypothetical protein